MRSMRNSIKRDLFFGIILSALVFASALALGGPFLAPNHSTAAAAGAAAQTTTLTGIVMRDGWYVFLSDSKGNVYQLDNLRHARKFDGKFVTVTGELDPQSKLVLVERIEPARA